MRNPIKTTSLAGLLILLAQAAHAGTVTSNQPGCSGVGTRIFSITTLTTGTCLTKGSGNINGGIGVGQDAPFMTGGPGAADDWIMLDKSDTLGAIGEGWLGLDGSGSTSGEFTIDPLAWANYGQIAIGFKSGGINAGDPDWAIFELAAGTEDGRWSISGLQQGLSHALIYGRGTPNIDIPPDQVIPEPGSITLLAAAGLAAGWARRRRG